MAEDQPNRIRVFLRVRPPKEQEKQWFAKNECRPILRDASQVPNPEKCIIIDKSGKRYDFDKVFDENSTQAQVCDFDGIILSFPSSRPDGQDVE